MSTGLECEFFEPRRGEWYYLLQDASCPVVTFDWREFATAYGPFASQEDASTHLHDTQPNPGGAMLKPYSSMLPTERAEYVKFTEKARKPDREEYCFRCQGYDCIC